MQITVPMFILLFLGGLFAGFVDSIAGGGGLIALPVILSLGLPPRLALGTNKLQGCFGTASASYNYVRKGKVNLKESYVGITFTFVGAALGTWTIQQMDAAFLEYIIPILLFIIFIYTLLSPKLGEVEQTAKMSPTLFFCAVWSWLRLLRRLLRAGNRLLLDGGTAGSERRKHD
jgi:uncharacterized membrane protein YfcA